MFGTLRWIDHSQIAQYMRDVMKTNSSYIPIVVDNMKRNRIDIGKLEFEAPSTD